MSSTFTPDEPRTELATRGSTWALLLLLAINLFNFIDRQVLSAVVPRIQAEFEGTTDAQIGMLATAFLLSYMCAAPIFGWLADRYSRWLLVACGVILWSLASGASGLATGITMLLITRLFVGVGEAAYGPAAPTIISDLYPVARRGRVLSCFYVAIPVGSALGYLLGGFVLSLGYDWRWAFYIVVPPGILLGVLALFMRDPPRDAGHTGPRKASLRNYGVLLRTPSYLLNTAGMTAMTFALGGIAFWMPKYIVWHSAQTGDPVSLEQANSLFGPIVVVSGLIATLAGGWLGDKLRARWSGSYFLVSGIAMFLGFPLVLLITVTPFPAAWILIFLACCCVFFNTGPTNTVLANVTHPSIRSSAYALNIFLIHVGGDAISPPLIGWINDKAGNMHAGFVAVSFAILVSGLFWIWGSRYLERDTQLAGSRVLPEAFSSR